MLQLLLLLSEKLSREGINLLRCITSGPQATIPATHRRQRLHLLFEEKFLAGLLRRTRISLVVLCSGNLAGTILAYVTRMLLLRDE